MHSCFIYYCNLSLGDSSKQQGSCSTEGNCGFATKQQQTSQPASSLALQPIQSDLLSLKIRPAGGPAYNIHELPSTDGKNINDV